MVREMGKVRAEAGGDVQEAIDMTFYMAGEGRRLFGQTTPSEMPDKFQMSVRQPVGVVGAITPWNFPIAIPSWKIAPALVCGNTVVFKPARDTPMLGQRFVEIFEEAGLPAGVLNIVHGGGESVGERLVKHPDVPLISLTGSREVGIKTAENGAAYLKHIHLELGGKNAIIVMDDADLDLAVEGIIWSAFGTSGPALHGGEPRHRRQGRSTTRSPRSSSSGPRSSASATASRTRPTSARSSTARRWRRSTRTRRSARTRARRSSPAARSRPRTGSTRAPSTGRRSSATSSRACGSRRRRSSARPPRSSRATDVDEAIRIANGIEFGLSSSIFTSDVNKAFKAMRDLNAGITYINAGTTGAEVHLPFGGTKGTGNGHREAGQAALDFYTEWKSIYVDYSGKLQRAQID